MIENTLTKNLVIGLVAQNENMALATASEALGARFVARGFRHEIVNLFVPANGDKLLALLKSGDVAFVYGYAGVGSRLELGSGANLWTASKVPYLSLWFDHPSYNYRQHIVESPYVAQCYHVYDHLETRRAHLPHSASLGFYLNVPWGMDARASSNIFSERQRKLLFVKTGIDPSIFANDWRRHSRTVQDALWNLVDLAKKDRNLNLADATKALFVNTNMPIEDLDLFMGIIQAVDAYIRAWRSDRLARALLFHESHIFGRGWDYLKDISAKATFFPPMMMSEYWHKMARYRMIANSSPLWRDGIHERVHFGMGAGAVTLTDRTAKADAIFNGLENYVGFDWNDDIEPAILKAETLSDGPSANFVPATEKAMKDRMLSVMPDYGAELLRVVDVVKTYGDSFVS